jgi:spermidine/putrescine transport system ATP-binding protein
VESSRNVHERPAGFGRGATRKTRLNSDVRDGNNLKGRVEDVIYIGTDTHYGVRFPGGQKVRVREQNMTQAQKSDCQTGDEVTVSFTRTSPRILTE